MTSKEKYKKSSTKASRYSTEKPFAVYVLAFLLFFPPFFKGLFFQKELLPAQILIGSCFLLYSFKERKNSGLKAYGWMDYGLIVLTLLYGITVFFSVNKSLAIQEALKYITFLLIFLLSRKIVDDIDKLYIVIKGIVIAGILVVCIGTGAALDLVNFSDAFVDGMMNSTFQYHNTFGAYCLAVLFLAYLLNGKEEKGPWNYVSSIAAFMLFFGFILSYSRGAWILLPPLGFLYYMLVSLTYKKAFISQLLGNVLALGVIINPFTQVLNQEGKSAGLIWILLGILFSVGASKGIQILLNKLQMNTKIYNIGIPVFTLILPIIGIALSSHILNYLPENLANRLANISLGTETVTERTVFYQDAFKIIKDYPLLGTGGGGWDTLYRMYQSYGYSSTQAHNYYMQLWIEIGTIGVAVLGMILLIYIYHLVNNYRITKDLDIKAVHGGLFIAIAAILGHSFIDFNMALTAIPILVWGMMGMQIGISEKVLSIRNGKKITSYGVMTLACILFAVSVLHFAAMNEIRSGIKDLSSGQVERGVKEMKNATRLNPFEPSYFSDYAMVINQIALQARDEARVKDSIKQMDKAMKLGSYDFKLLVKAASFYLNNGETDKGFEMIALLEKHHPLNSSTYENLTAFYVSVAEQYITEGKRSEAVKLLEDVIGIQDKMDELNKQIESRVKITNMVKFVEITPKTQENIDKAKELIASN
ncbi:O-antigen ligase family protein [Geosporobacter ferrireducens]|uniref:O-antigen ligase family protein n=1 Tax=Geosporobacter ferrireducens TaxID=1424294 RepID=UPI00139C2444|nr:O-antigen ligase family protein [Geosporobacter ferrireducens]MTI53313.1 O-antigen ligase family protein [Geosporobacter ferrireducens]